MTSKRTRWSALASLLVLGLFALAGRARADAPSPGQELCTVATQQRDGSTCESCMYRRFDEDHQQEVCGPLVARGWSERCAFGGMMVSAIYCDRDGDFRQVAGAPGSVESTGVESTRVEPTGVESVEVEPSVPPNVEPPDPPSPAPAAEATQVPPATPAAQEPAGCGCRIGGAAEGVASGAVLALALLGLARRRRRSRS